MYPTYVLSEDKAKIKEFLKKIVILTVINFSVNCIGMLSL